METWETGLFVFVFFAMRETAAYLIDFNMGSLIKTELKRQGRTATWLAKQVHCTPENIYKVFRQRWVSMPLLFEISRALNYDFFKSCSEWLKKV